MKDVNIKSTLLYIDTVRSGGFICIWLPLYCKALCDVKFCQIEGNGGKFRHIEPSKSVVS